MLKPFNKYYYYLWYFHYVDKETEAKSIKLILQGDTDN